MAYIIGILQVKGGAGRSTIATNLAGVLAAKRRVALIDCDMPQGTSQSWATLRLADKPDSLTVAPAANHTDLVDVVKRLNADHDYMVIDGPPRIAQMTRAALILSHLSLIPLGASAADIWATSDLLATIQEAQQAKPDVDARITWTRFRASTRSAQEISATARDILKLKELRSKLGYRVAYSEALARGMTVMEWPDPAARREFQAFSKEVVRILESK